MLYYILLHVIHKAIKHPPFLQTILRVFQLNVRGNGSWGGLTLFYQFRIREFFRFLHVSSGRLWLEWDVVFLWSNQWTSIVFKRTCDSFTKTAVNIVQFYIYKSNFQLEIISPTANETICFCICNLIESPILRIDACLFVYTAN